MNYLKKFDGYWKNFKDKDGSPSYPDYDEIKQFLTTTIEEVRKEAYEKGRTENIMALDLDVTKNFNKALKDKSGILIKMIQDETERVETIKIGDREYDKNEVEEALRKEMIGKSFYCGECHKEVRKPLSTSQESERNQSLFNKDTK